jgi:hypothetical protein
MSTAHDDHAAARSLTVLRVATPARLSLVLPAVPSHQPHPSDAWWELVDPGDAEDDPPLALVLVRSDVPGVVDLRLLKVSAEDDVASLRELVHQAVARLRRSDASLVTVGSPAADVRALLLEVGFVALPPAGGAERLILQL